MPVLPLEQLRMQPEGRLGSTFSRLIRVLSYNPGFHRGPESFKNPETDAADINQRTEQR